MRVRVRLRARVHASARVCTCVRVFLLRYAHVRVRECAHVYLVACVYSFATVSLKFIYDIRYDRYLSNVHLMAETSFVPFSSLFT